MKITAHCFTYGADGALALESCACLIDQGVTVRVWEQHDAPFKAEHRAALLALGAVIERTTFDRGGNLNGEACIRAMVGLMAETTPEDGWALKFDADTLIYRLDRIERAAAEGADAYGCVSEFRTLYGAGYWISGPALGKLQALLADPVEAGKVAFGEEDTTIGRMLVQAGCKVVLEPYEAAGTYLAGWRYHLTARTPIKWMPEFARRFDAATFGAWEILPGKQCDQREYAAVTMAKFRQVLRNLDQSTP